MRQFLIYLLRWQASSLILAPCIHWLAGYGSVVSAVVANFIGGCLFFWIDARIFKGKDHKRMKVRILRAQFTSPEGRQVNLPYGEGFIVDDLEAYRKKFIKQSNCTNLRLTYEETDA